MDELVEFLRARWDEDEQAARLALSAQWLITDERLIVFRQGSTDTIIVDSPRTQVRDLEHIARHDPARVLADVEAKRRILERYESSAQSLAALEAVPDYSLDAHRLVKAVHDANETAVKTLALPHADRAEWREEWRA